MKQAHDLHVLGIESSCDDTGVAILRGDGRILSNCVHSQLRQHLSLGGIIPMLAKEYHVTNIDQVANQAFAESNLQSVIKDIDAIAVSTRPGLNYSLQVGLNYARTLAKKYSKPLIPIHHMQAHALMPLLQNRSIRFPFLALLISGGHCLLSISRRYNDFHILGQTLDDAPGDLLDKIARRYRLRNLGEPFDRISGGAAIELLSRKPGANRFKYFNSQRAVPMIQLRNCDFSFSGYRGNVESTYPLVDSLWLLGDREKLLTELSHICSSLQRVIMIQLFKKLQRAISYYRMHWRYQNVDAFVDREDEQHLDFGIRTKDDSDFLDVVISGGVAANSYLIDTIRLACQSDIDPDINVFAPSKALCSDNGLMIAWNGLFKLKESIDSPKNCDTESIIYKFEQMDKLEVISDSEIGCDISDQVRQADFGSSRVKYPELKLHSD